MREGLREGSTAALCGLQFKGRCIWGRLLRSLELQFVGSTVGVILNVHGTHAGCAAASLLNWPLWFFFGGCCGLSCRVCCGLPLAMHATYLPSVDRQGCVFTTCSVSKVPSPELQDASWLPKAFKVLGPHASCLQRTSSSPEQGMDSYCMPKMDRNVLERVDDVLRQMPVLRGQLELNLASTGHSSPTPNQGS